MEKSHKTGVVWGFREKLFFEVGLDRQMVSRQTAGGEGGVTKES